MSRENREDSKDNNNTRENKCYMSVINVNTVKRPFVREINPSDTEDEDDDIDSEIEHNDRLIYIRNGEYIEFDYSDIEVEDDNSGNESEEREIILETESNEEYNNSNADVTYSEREN